MRVSQFFERLDGRPGDDVAGVTLDVLAGIVAGFALVIAILIIAATLNGATPVI